MPKRAWVSIQDTTPVGRSQTHGNNCEMRTRPHTFANVVQTLLRSAFAGDLAELYRCLPTYTHRKKRTWKASPYHYGKAPTRC